ncbi:hypothetical protein SAMN05428989_4108 [Pseudoxanthomonas sp. GM95]|uniref:hypothetical protein n=1 Tax=Pseudoxanthomonas sp. GM95 TaxID=1881043 RepID=UPI0008CC7780|nr:hypothetical protein [Pseudoxanthomonas sp. GM95]SEM58169.1 hypothetical protein SAMN05428989_4108 [Pseudoxanthomonas sp. GM95]
MKKEIRATRNFFLRLGICVSLCALTAFSASAVSRGQSAEDRCLFNQPQVFGSWSSEGLAKAISHIDCVWSERPVLLIGETHGTDETLALVTSLLEQQPITSKIAVGLEVPSSEDARISEFLKSSPTKEATDRLLNSDFWSYKDGRASQALLRFLTKISALNENGHDIEVFGIEDVQSGRRSKNPIANKELGMSAILKKRAGLGQKLIAVGGNFHIRIESPPSANSTTVPNQLRSFSPYVLLPTSSYGEAWTCLSMSDCAVHQRPQGAKSSSDDAVIKPEEENGIYAEILELPVLTASPPAKK